MPSDSQQSKSHDGEIEQESAMAADPDRKSPNSNNVQPSDIDQFAYKVLTVKAVPSSIEDEERLDDPKQGKAEDNLTLTMTELLSALKSGDSNDGGGGGEAHTPQGQSDTDHQTEKTKAVIELISSVRGPDDEGRSRQRILTFAARRYAMALERNRGDYDALYNLALVFQESADNVSPESSYPSKDALLEEACKKYKEATDLCPTLNDAYYNWAIAISDRAKLRGRTNAAQELWEQAAKSYEKAVQLNWNSPQALNNWGLALQELSSIVSARAKRKIVKDAVSKFRAALELQFDFHRAIYNLGTVLYGLAEDIFRSGGPKNEKGIPHEELYSQSAIYIAAAHALKPKYSVYANALKLVSSMLPLPYLKVGYLTAPPVGNLVVPHRDWKRSRFVLNHNGLQQIDEIDQSRISSKSGDSLASKYGIKVNIPDIVSVSAVSDLTLPPGAGMCIDTIHGTFTLIAESWEYLEGWLDAIRLVYAIYARGKTDVLTGLLTT